MERFRHPNVQSENIVRNVQTADPFAILDKRHRRPVGPRASGTLRHSHLQNKSIRIIWNNQYVYRKSKEHKYQIEEYT